MSHHDEDHGGMQQAAGAGSNLGRTPGSDDDNMDPPGTAGGFDPGTGGTGNTGTEFDEVGTGGSAMGTDASGASGAAGIGVDGMDETSGGSTEAER